MSSADKVLVIDDEFALREAICEYLQNAEFEVSSAGTASAAADTFRRVRPDAAVIDYQLPDGNALDVMKQLRASDPGLPVIILTGHGSIDLAVQAIKEGAEQFLTKPVELSALAVVLKRAIENKRNRHKQLAGKSRLSRETINPFMGSSAAIRELKDQAARVARADCPVLVLGETGSGKGVLARWIHENSARSREAFVDLNCAGLARELLESELFGHERGAFTGAINSKIGLFEVADKGTIFLDEIGDMDLGLQPKLLKVVELQCFRRLGDVKDRQVDARMLAATHQDLSALVHDKKFRADLYFRVNTVSLYVPALCERKEDIAPLAEFILARTAREIGRPDLQLDRNAIEAMASYSWPGNVRELKNVLERAALLSDGNSISERHLHFEPAARVALDSPVALNDMERLHIQRVLDLEHGHVARAASRLGISRSKLYYKLKEFESEAANITKVTSESPTERGASAKIVAGEPRRMSQ